MRRLLTVTALLLVAGRASAASPASRYLAVDQTLGPTGEALTVFGSAASRARACPLVKDDAGTHVRCLLAALGEVRTGGDGRLTTLLLERRGDPFSVAAAVLLLHGEPQRLEAVVFGSRVLLALPWDAARYFDPMESGKEMSIGLAFSTFGPEFSRAEHADTERFLGYYADRLAVASSSEPLFKRAIDVASSSARVRYDYGSWLLGQNRLDEAREELGTATRLGPDHLEAWLDRGTVLTKLGRWKAARKCYLQALRLEPRSKIAADAVRALDVKIAAEADAARAER